MLWSFVISTVLLGLLLWVHYLNKIYCVLAFFAKRVNTTDGSPLESIVGIPKNRSIFGSSFDMVGLDNVAIFERMRKIASELGRSYVEYAMGMTIYNVIDAENAEFVLTDPNLITKGFVYKFLEPFLRKGLLTSTGKKWHNRRKMITPAYHFNILTQFEEIFKDESRKFVRMLQSRGASVISLNEPISRFTLNSVCETAMGVKLDEQLDGVQYRQSFKMIEESFVKRTSNPLYMIESTYELLLASKYKKHLNVVHEFSSDLIKKRRQLLREERDKLVGNTDTNELEFSGKKRYAMLDTLLLAETEGLIDHEGICEEVDTFMFEGFDTTSMGLMFTLMNLALYPEMQERCYREIIENTNDDLSKLDLQQLSCLKYLECFIKETLRLYPSVPVIMRQALTETTLENKLILPAGTHITIHIFDVMRNPKHFPNPNKFDPDRFTQENIERRHPYSYIPFSAGQRNCIGQKFAMLEMKTLIVHILKHFHLERVTDPSEFQFETGVILRALKEVQVKFVSRM